MAFGVAAYGGHWWIANAKDNKIAELEARVTELVDEKSKLELSEQEQKATIEELEKTKREQQVRAAMLQDRNQTLTSERDRYLSIFKRHDLTKLSRAKPGLIEPRINEGTEEVLKQIEQDSKLRYEDDTNPYTTFIYPNL